MYPYRAYIEHLLSYGPAAKECQLTGVMWYKDTPGQQDKRTTDNKGFTTRNKNDVLSKSIKMMGKLHLDLFCQEKYFLNHVDLKMKQRRSRDAFALVADAANYKIKIKKMALSQNHIVLKVIHVAGGYRVHLYFYWSDGVFTAGLFQCFHVTHSNDGTQLYLSHIQSHFLDIDFIIGRVCNESKSVPTSSQFHFQIHVVE
jgi:hypothetical protein